MPVTKIQPLGVNSEATFTFANVNVTANLVSNNANLGNAARANFFIGNGSLLTGISTYSNTNVAAYLPTYTGNITANNVTVSNTLTTGTITTTGSSGNITGANVIVANLFQGNANSLSNIPGANVTGFVPNANVANTAFSVSGGNVSGQVANALIAGTVYTNAQPNITSVGTLTSLSVTGNITSGNANLGNAATANFFVGNGSLLTGISAVTAVSLINGNSNVVVTANSNVTISAVGNANIVTVTGTGVNVAGILNVTGNTVLGNLTVTGNTTVVNSTVTQITDPLIDLGGGANGAALTTNDNMDRGSLLRYYTTQPVDAFIGWKNANSEFLVASNVTNNNNIVTINTLANLRANFFIGDGSRLTNINTSQFANGNSNITMTANGPIVMSAVGSFSVLSVGQLGANVGGTLGVSGNLTTGNATLGNLATANFISGTLVGASGNQSNITTVGQLTNLSVLGNANIGGFTNITGNLTAGNANLGNAVSANFILGNGYLLTGIGGAGYIFNGNSNANIATSGGNLVVSINGTGGIATFSNVGLNVSGYMSATGNINATGNMSAGNANLGNAVRANFFLGDGSLLTGIGGAGYIFNGTSNANIASANGNLTVSINGVSNVSVFSSTGVNVAGFVTATGNITANNIFANTGTINGQTLGGTLTTASQPNITSLGNLTSLIVTGQANVGNLITPTTINAVGTITGGNLSTGGTLNVTGNANVGNIGAGIGVFTGNISATNANLGNSVVANFFTGNFYGPANTAGTVTTNAQPNITSVGTLTGLTVTGNAAFSGSNVSLGSVGNVKITGGSLNQYLRTDGTGNLSWGTPSGGGGGGTALTYTASTTPPISANIADQWYNTDTDILYQYVNDGTTSYWVDVSTPTTSSTVVTSGIIVQEDGNVISSTANTINFVGNIITATSSGNIVTVTVANTISSGRTYAMNMFLGI